MSITGPKIKQGTWREWFRSGGIFRKMQTRKLYASAVLLHIICIEFYPTLGYAANTNFEATLFKSTTSTTARNVADRFHDIINVKDFGAVGDGSTIDTAAIQAAIDWTGSNTPVGCVFFPYGTYIVDAPINFGSDITLSICLLGVGVGSTIQTINAGLPGQAVLSRAAGPTNDTSTITIEKLEVVNFGQLGCAIELGASSLGVSVRDCFIHADIGISCGEFVNPTQVTSASTSSGTTLTFAAGVPQRVIDNYNNGHGAAVTITDVTAPGSIAASTTVAGATSTTVTLSQAVAGTVGNGDTIQFTWTTQESVRGAWEVVIERVHCEAHHDYIPGSFGIAVIENSVIQSVDMDTYDNAIRVCGVGNTINASHIETCRKAIVMGMMPNGVAQTGSNFAITGLGAESNGYGIDFTASMGTGIISGCGQNVAQYAVPYTGNPVSGIAVTGSNSGATGTAAVAYNVSHSQWEMTLTAVTGTFQVGDNVGDGVNIPSLTNIGFFQSGSGGSGTVCAGLSGQGEYGLHGATLMGGQVVVSGCGFQGYYNQAAIDSESGNGAANVTFISCNAVNNIAGKPAWITPSIAGDAQYINCNLDQPKFAFNNLRPYPYTQRGDNFTVNNSSVSSFNGTVDGAGSSQVQALASTIVTGTTNNTTAIGNNTLHFASTPAGIVNGMVVGDSTVRLGQGIQPFPAGTIVQSQTATTVVLSNNATTQVGNGDLIGFVQWTVH